MAVIIQKADIAGLKQSFSKVPSLIRKPFRGILKTIGTLAVDRMRSGITWDSKYMRKACTYKIKSYKRAKYYWVGVGVLKAGTEGVGNRKVKVNPGWRAHMYDRGWRPFPKGAVVDKKGKGWRKRDKRVGALIYATHFIDNANFSHADVRARVQVAVNEVIRRLKTGIK